MLSRRGARVVHGPTMRTDLLDDVDATIEATRRVLAGPVDLVVLTTGIGVRSWFGVAASVGLEDDLRTAFRDGRGGGARTEGPVGGSFGRPRGDVDGADRDQPGGAGAPARGRSRRPADRRAARRRCPAVRRRPGRARPGGGRRRPGLPLAPARRRHAGPPPPRRRRRRTVRRRDVHVLLRRAQRLRHRPGRRGAGDGVRRRRPRRRRRPGHGGVAPPARCGAGRRAVAGPPRIDDPRADRSAGGPGPGADPRRHVPPVAGHGADRRRRSRRSS